MCSLWGASRASALKPRRFIRISQLSWNQVSPEP